MPRSKHPHTLRKFCVQVVVRHLNSFFIRKCVSFTEIPVILLQEIIKTLVYENNFKLEYLQLLLKPNIRFLNLSRKHFTMVNYLSEILEYASKNCKDLEELKINGDTPQIFAPLNFPFTSFISKFRKLKTLDVSCTNSDDECLKMLGLYCSDLLSLNVTACPVTDDGIIALCGHSKQNGKRIEGCRLIQILKIGITKITPIGAEFSLNHLPNLKIFHYEYSLLVLSKMSLRPFSSSKVSLVDLYWNPCFIDAPLTGKNIGLALKNCQLLFIRKLHMVCQKGIMDKDLLIFGSLTFLEDINISNMFSETVTFSGGIAPLLKMKFGKSLDKLTISNFPEVDIKLIIESCPNLISLRLFKNKYRRLIPEEIVEFTGIKILKYLKVLCLRGTLSLNKEDDIPAKDIMALLLSSKLVVVKFSNNNSLTDEILIAACRIHQFKYLEHLEFFKCQQLTNLGINAFKSEENFLTKYFVEACPRVEWKEIHLQWTQFKKERNWNLIIDFSS